MITDDAERAMNEAVDLIATLTKEREVLRAQLEQRNAYIKDLVSECQKAYDEAESNPNMVRCPRCEGKGYHHGFGENGYDPDWCELCEGTASVLAEGEELRPMTAALTVARPIIEREVLGALYTHNQSSLRGWKDGAWLAISMSEDQFIAFARERGITGMEG